jgi:two-component system cell cycle response regulator DivK
MGAIYHKVGAGRSLGLEAFDEILRFGYKDAWRWRMSGRRILLVEDDLDNLEMVRFVLEGAGYQILIGRTGVEAVKLAREERPDLILMDLSLPEKDGWTAAAEIKADPALRAIPLIALTAHTLPGDRKRALEAGFDVYISKPIDLPSLFKALAAFLPPQEGAGEG